MHNISERKACTKLKQKLKNRSSENCVICLDALVNKTDHLFRAKCNHMFHRSCIMGVQFNLCPLCRQPMTDYKQIEERWFEKYVGKPGFYWLEKHIDRLRMEAKIEELLFVIEQTHNIESSCSSMPL